jgi:nitrate/nitrite transporter NarK
MSINDHEKSNLLFMKNQSERSTAKEPLIVLKAVGYRAGTMRWLALALACLNCIGSYFCFDNPQSLQTIIIDQFGISSFQFNLLYSVYAFPNIILPFVGGIIIDRLGVRVGIALFSFLLIIGQLVFTWGAASGDFTIMLIGRVIFGLGGECLNVAQSVVTTKWFMGKELALALGATLCVARLGSSLNSFFAPKIYYWTNALYAPLLVGAVLCLFSFLIGLGLNYLDKKADEQEGITGKQEGENVEQVKLSDLKNLNLIFYLLLFNGFFLYGGFYGLNNNLNDLMVQRFGFTPDTAGNYIPIIYICAAVFIPLIGAYIDHKGKRALLMIFACILFVFDHLVTALLPTSNPGQVNYAMVGILFGVGMFYASYAAIFWPCIPIVVPEKVQGTAFGIVFSSQNLMLTIIPLIIGAIHDATEEVKKGYFWTEITLAVLALIGLFLTIWIYIEDLKTDKKLDKPCTDEQKISTKKSIAKSFVKF